MSLLFQIVVSCLLSLIIAQGIGLTLGLLAIRIRVLAHFSNLLTELRGSLGLSALGLLAIHTGTLGPLVAIAFAAGLAQAIAIARWMTRVSGTWAPEELGAIAIGESSTHLALLRGYRRGAVRASASLSALHCIALWALVLQAFPKIAPGLDSVNPWLLGAALAFIFIGNELASTRLSNRRSR